MWWMWLALLSCSDEPLESGPLPELDVHSWANGCYAVESGGKYLARSGDGYGFVGAEGDAEAFHFRASDLGTYLLYDADGGYVVADTGVIVRQTELESDMTTLDDAYISGAEWVLETAPRDPSRHQLRSRRTGALLGQSDPQTTVPSAAAAVRFVPTEGCATYPELTLDATGTPARTTWEDGSVYGVVDMHSHILSNVGFGGAMFHGAPFHRLGVEHALPDCTLTHGEAGRRDFFGYAYDNGNNGDSLSALLPSILNGELSEDNHNTDGYPKFTEWPNARERSTHQVQYYRWLERAYLGGLRLVVQHATSNSILCEISAGIGFAGKRYSCDDMTAVDRAIDDAYQMERYIDAQSGGPGKGWFRIVTTPAEAREVITEGKLAVVLGIETSNLFECRLTPRAGDPVCDEAYIDAQLDAYHDRGIRVLFPVHKYDNAFTPGDGSGEFIEVGNFLNSGHYTNMTQDCPGIPGSSDQGEVTFGGLNQPREVYDAPAPYDFSDLETNTVEAILPHAAKLLDGPLEGEWCQNATMTPQGEYLLNGIMKRGMVVELDHFPQRSYARAFEMLTEAGYPAVGTHGRDYGGRIYDIGGFPLARFSRCQDANNPGASVQRYRDQIALMTDKGQYPSVGFGFDLNGFAGAPGPRFGERGCGEDQPNRLTYPFTAYDGGVSFSEPRAGERVFDFNTEGMIHIGLMPEYIQDLRADGGDEAIEPLFRSAEAYIRMWETAEASGAALP